MGISLAYEEDEGLLILGTYHGLLQVHCSTTILR